MSAVEFDELGRGAELVNHVRGGPGFTVHLVAEDTYSKGIRLTEFSADGPPRTERIVALDGLSVTETGVRMAKGAYVALSLVPDGEDARRVKRIQAAPYAVRPDGRSRIDASAAEKVTLTVKGPVSAQRFKDGALVGYSPKGQFIFYFSTVKEEADA
ncbi:hypothetical protein [Cupriavidus sp. TMH.W2]|uniref:hypothetical protein n=1 Tax=Cupriavidus sp. TMH.W2 TaxID=3434465 RepID=UPI003D7720D9